MDKDAAVRRSWDKQRLSFGVSIKGKDDRFGRMDKIQTLTSENGVVIFSKSTCCLCYAVNILFHELGVEPLIHETDHDPEGREIEKALVNLGCNSPPLPAVYIGGNLIGSTNEVMTLHLNMDIGGHPSYTSLCPQTADGENSEGFSLGVDTTVYLVEMLYFVRLHLLKPRARLIGGRPLWSILKVVSEQLDIEKDGISEKKRKRSSSESSLQDPTYDQLMTTVTKLEGTVATLTETVSTLHGTIGTLESRLLTLEGDARVSTLTQTVSSLQCTINTLESRLLALEGDEREFGVVSDGDIAPYMSPGLSYTSPASTAQKSLPLAHRRKLRVRRTLLKLKSPMRCYSRIGESMFEKKKTDCYLDCLPKGLICEPSFWDVLYPGGEKAELTQRRKLDGLHINAFIELMMRKRPHNAQWTLGLSELVAFHIDSGMRLSMVSVVDALRATIDGTNPRYPSWHKISQVFFPINLGNKHWVAAAWNLDDYVLMVYDSLESLENGEKIVDLLTIWKDFIEKRLGNHELV
ncbi:phospholipase-like protein [Tanacetum coccineum]